MKETKIGTSFTSNDSLTIKGAAIVMMLWHHALGLENLSVGTWPLKNSQILHIAVFCKICVSLFAFVSGYGLWISWLKAKKENIPSNKWIMRRLIRTLSGYWFVVILSWIICTFINNWAFNQYGFNDSPLLGLCLMLLDFSGLTNLFGLEPLNPIWWYMSAAIIFIIIIPLLDKMTSCFSSVYVIALIWILSAVRGGYPGAEHFFSFLPMFCMGVFFSSENLFEKWVEFWQKHNIWIKWIALVFGMGMVYKLYHALDINHWWNVKFSVLPLVPIFLIWEISRLLSSIGCVLKFIGKHATNIFLVHAFLYAYYACGFIYGTGHFILVLIRLLWSSIIISLAIEKLKKLVRYDKKISKLINAIS